MRSERLAAAWLGFLLAGCGPAAPTPGRVTAMAQLRAAPDSATLRAIAADEEPRGEIARRREVLTGFNRQLLMPPPADAIVPELFDLVVLMAPHLESGDISPAWAGYLYTTYQRDLVRDRPTGLPRRSREQIAGEVERSIEFYHLQARAGSTPPGASPAEDDFNAVQDWRNKNRLGR